MAVILYFSRPYENLMDGKKTNLKQGNTKVVAQKIAHSLFKEAVEIIPIKKYPEDYQKTVDQAELEKKMDHRPMYKEFPIQLLKDQTIFLGYPNWWGTFPMVIATFLEAHDFTGKTIYPFCTHEGSGMGNSLNDLQKLCPQTIIEHGLPVRGSRVEKSDVAINNWLQQYKFEKMNRRNN